MPKKRVLILGVSGMLGHTLFKHLIVSDRYAVFGTARSGRELKIFFTEEECKRIRFDVEADNFDALIRALASVRPDIVVNCIGLIKQLPISSDPLTAISINAQLPHRISLICSAAHARMIHISTDCVFDGQSGMYAESDIASPTDLYGRTKLLGELTCPHCITLRTSIIGHELKGKLGLVEWFLAQKDTVQGYTGAIYSGFTTVELSRIIERYILSNDTLSGLYHVSADPISKHDLLTLVKQYYNSPTMIEPNHEFVCDRSMNSDRFRQLTGYKPPDWNTLVASMHDDYVERYKR